WDERTRELFYTKVLVPSLLDRDENYVGSTQEDSAKVRFLDEVFHQNLRAGELMDLHFSEERNENRPVGKKIADISEEDLLIDLLYLSEENMGNDSVESFISEEHLKFSAGYLRANPNARDALMLVHEEFRNVILGAKDQKVSLRDWSKISEIIFTKFFLWKKFFEYPRYQQNWISQFVSDVRGGIQERQATLGDRFVSRHTDDEGAFLATMNYAKDAANLTETGVWIILDSFIFAGLEGATDWGYLAHEQGKLQLDPTLGDSTLAEFMLYLEAAGAATIFMPLAKGSIKGFKAIVSGSLKGGATTLIKEGEKGILEAVAHTLPERPHALPGIPALRELEPNPAIRSTLRQNLDLAEQKAKQATEILSEKFGFLKNAEGTNITTLLSKDPNPTKEVGYHLRKLELAQNISRKGNIASLPGEGAIKGQFMFLKQGLRIQYESKLTARDSEFLENILKMKHPGHSSTSAFDTQEKIKDFLKAYGDPRDPESLKRLQIRENWVDGEQWGDLLENLGGPSWRVKRIEFLDELGTRLEESDHAIRYAFEMRSYLKKLLAQRRPHLRPSEIDNIITRDIQGAYGDPMTAYAKKIVDLKSEELAKRLNVNQLSLHDQERFETAAKIATHMALEKSAYHSKVRLYQALAKDPLFSDLIEVTEKGGVKLTAKGEQAAGSELTTYWRRAFSNPERADELIFHNYIQQLVSDGEKNPVFQQALQMNIPGIGGTTDVSAMEDAVQRAIEGVLATY
ncbi:MAG: hypothetical protein HYY62_04245, partial [Deltaproteobacteria bacterium]|nr:hypothetical protein [Deltaproteobacteria bacterium]